MRAICCALAALLAFNAITAHRDHHITYRTPPAHNATTEQP